MSPPARLWGACRTLAIRARPMIPNHGAALAVATPQRYLSTENNSTAGDVEAMLKSANMKGVVEAHGLQALQGGLTPEQEQTLYEEGVIRPASTGNRAIDDMAEIATGLKVVGSGEGHKFPLPELPLPWHMQMKNRYHPVLMQISRLLMREGKLSKAQSVCFFSLVSLSSPRTFRSVFIFTHFIDTPLLASGSSSHYSTNVPASDLKPQVSSPPRRSPLSTSPTQPHRLPHSRD